MNDVFSQAVSIITLGIIPDFQTAIAGLVAIFFIGIGLDLLVTRAFGVHLGRKVDSLCDELNSLDSESRRNRTVHYENKSSARMLNKRRSRF